ncbi:BET1-like protein [Strongylocentrotus purpuratus]|uniref:BET1-like protein n=1 Tax=Strongylocentrotus purpuratus TaxID=7668 RepID=A0A7M7GLZ2_STRPU|nr:BET1-like protein [Strongylocentrotus purpuratus]|eukprot:XP_003728514.1 PREDICTED: BET1-like protein isoform X1 [Strongylocentrotus purpuratus]
MSDWDWNSRKAGGQGGGKMSTEDMLEGENDRMTLGLAAKVSTLKSIAKDMENEANDQNVYLDGMHDDFSSSEGLLSGTVKRLDGMFSSGRGNRKLMCYMILGLVIFFVFAYLLLSRVTGH